MTPPPDIATDDDRGPVASAGPDARSGNPATEEPADAHPASGPASGYVEWASQWGADTPEGSATSCLGLVGLITVMALIGVLFSWYIVIAIMAIVVSVILHEAGHFIAAKKSGMKVTEAFVGFGPRIWSFRRGETEYGIKAVWAGAYVRIIGMHNLEEVAEQDEEQTYRAKSYPRRLVTILAGPLANIFLCWILLTGFVFAGGLPDDQVWPIEEIVDGSAAASAGLLPGDQIVSVNGVRTETYEDFTREIRAVEPGEVTIDFDRDGQRQSVNPNLDWRIGREVVAIEPLFSEADIVESVGGRPVADYDEFRAAMRQDGSVPVVVQRRDYVYELPIVGPLELPAEGAIGFLGVRPIPTMDRPQVSYSLPAAGLESVRFMGRLLAATGESLGRFFSADGLSRYGRDLSSAASNDARVPKPLHPLEGASSAAKPDTSTVSQDRPSSIIGGTQALGAGLEYGGLELFFFILAVINLSLGALNLLPLLPFDGGHATVATYERLRSRKGRAYRVDMTKLLPLTYGVVALVIVFGLTSMFLDIRSPVAP